MGDSGWTALQWNLGYIENTVSLEMNEQYGHIIEKKAENMYRTINQKLASFPASNKVMRQKITIPKSINLDAAGDGAAVGVCVG